MIKVVLHLLLLIASVAVSAQTTEHDYYNPQEPVFNKPAENLIKPNTKPQVGFMTGASISSFGQGISGSTTFMAPYLSYALSPRLNVSAAAVFGTSTIHGDHNLNKGFAPNSFNSKSFSLGMEYKITEHLRIGGAIQMNQGIGPNLFNPMNGGVFPTGF